MSSQESYQLSGTYDLKPVYISLGLPNSTFGTNGQVSSKGPFDTALDGGMQFPDSLWFFRGEDMQGRLFLRFAANRQNKSVAALRLEDLTAGDLLAFLQSLEQVRKASIRTRNCRLAALRSFFSFVASHEPLAAKQCAEVLGVPF